MNIGDRLKAIIANEKISVRAFEISIGASNGLIRKAINGGTQIQSRWLTTISEKFPHYSKVWLLTGEGSMLKEDAPPPTQREPETPPTTAPDAMSTIIEQATRIGRLEQEAIHLRQEAERQRQEAERQRQAADILHTKNEELRTKKEEIAIENAELKKTVDNLNEEIADLMAELNARLDNDATCVAAG